MNRFNTSFLLVTILSISFISCEQKKEVTKIAFGSCGWQDEPQPVLALAAEQKPDAFIFLGDNIYGDTENMDTLQAKYNRWGAMEEFKKLERSSKRERSFISVAWDI